MAVSHTSPPKITTKKQANGSIALKLVMIDVREGAVSMNASSLNWSRALERAREWMSLQVKLQ